MKTKLPLFAICLLLAGCIKNPPTPPGPKPEWLLKKISTTDANFDPNLGIIYNKYTREYFYRNNKPYRCVYHSANYYSEGDTNNLRLSAIDSFFYDSRGRVTQVNHYQTILQSINQIDKHYYSGNNQLPVKVEWYRKDSSTPFVTNRYSYTDTSVTAIRPYYKGGFDTTIYFFDIRGNYTRQYSSLSPGDMRLNVYDNAPNLYRFLNVENAMVFQPDYSSEWLTRFSQNNWTRLSATYWDGPRIITLNEQGLVIQTVLTHDILPHDKPQLITRYEYRHAD